MGYLDDIFTDAIVLLPVYVLETYVPLLPF